MILKFDAYSSFFPVKCHSSWVLTNHFHTNPSIKGEFVGGGFAPIQQPTGRHDGAASAHGHDTLRATH